MFNSYLKFKLCYFSRISVIQIAPRGGFYFAILALPGLEPGLNDLESSLLTITTIGQSDYFCNSFILSSNSFIFLSFSSKSLAAFLGLDKGLVVFG